MQKSANESKVAEVLAKTPILQEKNEDSISNSFTNLRHATPATPATPEAQPKGEQETASRGACVHCGEIVTWTNGLRNWFGELVHLSCSEAGHAD
jgi:hypothetical protein